LRGTFFADLVGWNSVQRQNGRVDCSSISCHPKNTDEADYEPAAETFPAPGRGCLVPFGLGHAPGLTAAPVRCGPGRGGAVCVEA